MNIFKRAYTRIILLSLFAIAEVVSIFYLFNLFYNKVTWLEPVLSLASVVIVLNIINHSKHLSQDLLWIVLVMLSPVLGTAIYLMLGANMFLSRTYRSIMQEEKRAKEYYVQDQETMQDFSDDAPNMRGQVRYIAESAGYPIYRNTGFEYYPSGEAGLSDMLNELEKAEKFIFLEYFIIEEGVFWDAILCILKKKVKEGVEVRVMYDDFGSITTLNADYSEQLEKEGIKCVTFNRMNPVINVIMNHRDHRKIMVIDGKVAFSGGINLADEYINRKTRFGYWKDNVFKVVGNAVWSYTVMFLTNWNALRHEDADYQTYKAPETDDFDFDGYVAPFGETPLDTENTSQNIYLNIINQANDYVYIATPYLVIDTDMINSMILAAKRGVDVRIITPGIPDKKIVYDVTRSYYDQLIEGGVRIYEYTPGFIHAKIVVSDDLVATVGTINLDYRSLYLHFENGTYMYDSGKILDIKKDVCDTLEVSHEVTDEEVIKRSVFYKLFVSLIKLFAPLL